VIGKNVFYSTKNARYVVVGSVLDLDKKVDITDQRLKELASLDAATSKITAAGGAVADQTGAVQPAPGQPSPLPAKIDVNLPVANAVVHNPGAPIKLTVFSDYNCHYCRALFTEMVANKQIEVREYPIGLLSADSSTKAQQVLCADNRLEASEAQFGISANGKFRTVGSCAAAAAAVEANTKFAASHGISGTPTIIRADGTAHAGYLAQDALVAFGSARS
jgi:thiol:disulfide interchange protein DsbC